MLFFPFMVLACLGKTFSTVGAMGHLHRYLGERRKVCIRVYVSNRICLMSEFWPWVVLEFCEVSCAQNSCSPSGSWSPLPLGEHYTSWALPFSKAAKRPLPEFLHGMLHSFQLLLPLSVYGPWVLIRPTPNRQPMGMPASQTQTYFASCYTTPLLR